jgi:hypothetical protein
LYGVLKLKDMQRRYDLYRPARTKAVAPSAAE